MDGAERGRDDGDATVDPAAQVVEADGLHPEGREHTGRLAQLLRRTEPDGTVAFRAHSAQLDAAACEVRADDLGVDLPSSSHERGVERHLGGIEA